MKSKWEIWKEKNSEYLARPWDLINPKVKKVSEEIYNKRYEI